MIIFRISKITHLRQFQDCYSLVYIQPDVELKTAGIKLITEQVIACQVTPDCQQPFYRAYSVHLSAVRDGRSF